MEKRSYPYGKHEITEADIEAVVDVLRSGWLTQGPKVEEFESKICEKVGALYAVGVNSATSALHIACLALGLQEGDELWTTAITFVASANCARFCGANVSLVDINPETGLMSCQSLEKKLRSRRDSGKSLPKIVIPVHLSGASCDMAEIHRLSKRFGFKIIEDASHAIGGTYKSRPVGCCEYSDITVFSFHPVKVITSGEGGIATTNNRELSQKLQRLRAHGIVRDRSGFLDRQAGVWAYEQQCLGFNYRMSDIHAALGISQLERLEEIVAARQMIYDAYLKFIRDPRIRILSVPQDVSSSVHLVVAVVEKISAEEHKRLYVELRSRGIGAQLHYTPIHWHPYYYGCNEEYNELYFAEEYARRAVSLPVYPGLQYSDIKHIVIELESVVHHITSGALG